MAKSYIGRLHAKEGKILLGGVKEHLSSRFESRSQASFWVKQALKANSDNATGGVVTSKLPFEIEDRTGPRLKLKKLAEQNGVSVAGLLERYHLESVVPGICMREDCDYSTDVEPDQDRGYCENCALQSIKSCLRLAGVI